MVSLQNLESNIYIYYWIVVRLILRELERNKIWRIHSCIDVTESDGDESGTESDDEPLVKPKSPKPPSVSI